MVVHVCANDRVGVGGELSTADNVQSNTIGGNLDIGMIRSVSCECGCDGLTCRICYVKHTSVAVATLPSEMERVSVSIEFDS